METEIPEVKPDPTVEELTAIRPKPISQSEKEVFEGKIAEQKTEIDELKKRLDEKEKPEPTPKAKKHWSERYCPL